MTKVWGPMGWMTLHSISVCYPEEPTPTDKQILNEFMNAFGGCITCIYCRQHFGTMFSEYKQSYPGWANSRYDLFLAVCRMHNAVNKRLDKPYPKTVEECLNSLKNATSYTSPRDFRERYVNYAIGDWSKIRSTAEGYAGFQNANTMKKINDEYWNNREVSYANVKFPEADVLGFSKTIPGPLKLQLKASKLSDILGRTAKKLR